MSISDTVTDGFLNSPHLTNLLKVGSWALRLVYALVTLAALAALIINITKLACSGGNPMERSRALHNIGISGICLAVLGGLGTVYAIFVGIIL